VTKPPRAARSLWLGGRPEDTASILSARFNDPDASFPDIAALLSAFEANLEASIRRDPHLWAAFLVSRGRRARGGRKDTAVFDRIIQMAREINEDWPLPIPLKIHIDATVAYNTYCADGVSIQLDVAPESWRVLRLYNQLRDLRVQEVLGAPIVISEDAGRFRIVVQGPVGWDDDPFALGTES